jgi:hypothetical protein
MPPACRQEPSGSTPQNDQNKQPTLTGGLPVLAEDRNTNKNRIIVKFRYIANKAFSVKIAVFLKRQMQAAPTLPNMPMTSI